MPHKSSCHVKPVTEGSLRVVCAQLCAAHIPCVLRLWTVVPTRHTPEARILDFVSWCSLWRLAMSSPLGLGHMSCLSMLSVPYPSLILVRCGLFILHWVDYVSGNGGEVIPSAVDFTSEYWGAETASHPCFFFTPLASADAAPFKHHCQLWDWVNVLGVPCSALVFTVWPSEDLVLITRYMNMQRQCHVWARRCYKLRVCLTEFAFAPSLLSLAFFCGDHKIWTNSMAICSP